MEDLTKARKTRSTQQNRAIHLYFTWLAEELNNAGLDMKAVLKPDVSIPWTADNVKNHLWKGIQRAMLNIESTTDLKKSDVSRVYEVLNRHIGEKFGIYVRFPDKNDMK